MGLNREVSVATGVVLAISSWFVPGLGFVLQRNYWRGVAIFLLISSTFLIGLLLHGTVLMAEFHYRSPSFNIVSLLTFLGQMGNGGASLVCLAHDKWNWGLFQPIETDPRFDVATLYLLVSGCMNYFCVCNVYDRYVARQGQGGTPVGEES